MRVDTDFQAIEHEGHVFRSQLLNQFARIECWVVERFEELGVKATKNPFGQKVSSLRAHSDRFQKPKRIGELADRIEAALALRGDIVHAEMQTAKLRDEEPLWLFHNIADTQGKNRLVSTVMTRAKFETQISQLKALSKELTDQRLKAPAPAVPAPASA